MKRSEFLDLLDKYLEGEATPEEAAAVEKFYDHFQNDAHGITDWAAKKKAIEIRMRQGIARSIHPHRTRMRHLSRQTFMLAASIVLLLVISLIAYKTMHQEPAIEWITRTTTKGKKLQITLADGSKVHLNADSKISYPKTFNQARRDVKLLGEAFFEVSKDARHPFVIETANVQTTVLGTSFNVSAFPDEETIVTVVTGRVSVEAVHDTLPDGSSPHVILTPRQQVRYVPHADICLVKEVDISLAPFTAWKDGIIYLEQTRLDDMARILERWYNVEIEFEDDALKAKRISGKYKNDALVNILNHLKFILQVDYTKQGNKIIIQNKTNA